MPNMKKIQYITLILVTLFSIISITILFEQNQYQSSSKQANTEYINITNYIKQNEFCNQQQMEHVLLQNQYVLTKTKYQIKNNDFIIYFNPKLSHFITTKNSYTIQYLPNNMALRAGRCYSIYFLYANASRHL